jgi:hypothetical protein
MAKTFYTVDQVHKIRQSAYYLGMQAHPDFFSMPVEKLVLTMNGCGPDSWTDSMRFAATWVYRNFPEAIAIHDFDFEHSDGEEKTLTKVNKRFHDNNVNKLNYLYPYSSFYVWPVRAWAYGKLEAAYIALKNGSLSAWKSAHERFNNG